MRIYSADGREGRSVRREVEREAASDHLFTYFPRLSRFSVAFFSLASSLDCQSGVDPACARRESGSEAAQKKA